MQFQVIDKMYLFLEIYLSKKRELFYYREKWNVCMIKNESEHAGYTLGTNPDGHQSQTYTFCYNMIELS